MRDREHNGRAREISEEKGGKRGRKRERGTCTVHVVNIITYMHDKAKQKQRRSTQKGDSHWIK